MPAAGQALCIVEPQDGPAREAVTIATPRACKPTFPSPGRLPCARLQATGAGRGADADSPAGPRLGRQQSELATTTPPPHRTAHVPRGADPELAEGHLCNSPARGLPWDTHFPGTQRLRDLPQRRHKGPALPLAPTALSCGGRPGGPGCCCPYTEHSPALSRCPDHVWPRRAQRQGRVGLGGGPAGPPSALH